MNIHFTDKELFEKLKLATLAKVKVGSHLYGTNNENSDIDYLYIYATSEAELKSFVWTNHQLQYKEDGIDHNFVSLHSFVRNIINGDSTINFEVVHSDELKGTWLGFLEQLAYSFNTYTIIRSYLGFARRDCKHFSKCTTDYEKRKKIEHIVRSYLIATTLMDDTFNFVYFKDLLKDVMSRTEISLSTVKYYAEQLDVLRIQLNAQLDNKTLGLAKIMDVTHGKNLEGVMKMFQQHDEFKNKQKILKDFDMSIFINAFENWVTYD